MAQLTLMSAGYKVGLKSTDVIWSGHQCTSTDLLPAIVVLHNV